METEHRHRLMSLRTVATIATLIVAVAGFVMISPLFFQPGGGEPKQKVLLSFSVSPYAGAAGWCRDLSALLNAHDVGAVVFITGETAEQHPECVSYFSRKVDIGSRTYSNTDLTSIADYSLKLREVEKGKQAVDAAGHLNSAAFSAPFGATDQDIYSLLSRSGIMADFSYENQYNVYEDGQFVRYGAAVYAGRDYPPDYFPALENKAEPMIITFDDTDSVQSIERFLSGFDMDRFQLVNASELVGFVLTER